MISPYYGLFNPVCDCCGHMIGAEKSIEAAEAAMQADSWHKADGKDVCRLCWLHYEETGKFPKRILFYKEEST